MPNPTTTQMIIGLMVLGCLFGMLMWARSESVSQILDRKWVQWSLIAYLLFGATILLLTPRSHAIRIFLGIDGYSQELIAEMGRLGIIVSILVGAGALLGPLNLLYLFRRRAHLSGSTGNTETHA